MLNDRSITSDWRRIAATGSLRAAIELDHPMPGSPVDIKTTRRGQKLLARAGAAAPSTPISAKDVSGVLRGQRDAITRVAKLAAAAVGVDVSDTRVLSKQRAELLISAAGVEKHSPGSVRVNKHGVISIHLGGAR